MIYLHWITPLRISHYFSNSKFLISLFSSLHKVLRSSEWVKCFQVNWGGDLQMSRCRALFPSKIVGFFLRCINGKKKKKIAAGDNSEKTCQSGGRRAAPAVCWTGCFFRVSFSNPPSCSLCWSAVHKLSDCRLQSCLGISVCWLMNPGFPDGWLPQLHFGGEKPSALAAEVDVSFWFRIDSCSCRAAEPSCRRASSPSNIYEPRRFISEIYGTFTCLICSFIINSMAMSSFILFLKFIFI